RRLAPADTLAPPGPRAASGPARAHALKGFLSSYPGRVLIAADSPGRREALLEILHAAEVRPEVLPDVASFLPFPPPLPLAGEGRGEGVRGSGDGKPPSSAPSGHLLPQAGEGKFAIAVAPLEDGFAFDEPQFTVLTERQLFPERAAQPRRRQRAGREPEAIIRDLGELSDGAPIVHEDHGVGRYRGLVTLEAGGEKNEFVEIEYAKGDRLYVPVSQLHLINRYSGASPETAPLH